jgi:hypothetical protein
MALDITSLKTSPGLPGAGGADYPATRAACAAAWADAAEAWASAIVPASSAVSAAAATLETALNAAFGSGTVAADMETAFLAFATTVGGGMAGFVPTPPPAPVGFSALFALAHPATRQEGVDRFADAIDTWMRTGTATPSGGGSPVNWS